MNDERHNDFLKALEKEGPPRYFEVTIRGREEIQLTLSEVTNALCEAVNAKAEALEGEKPYFDIDVSTYSVRVGSEASR